MVRHTFVKTHDNGIDNNNAQARIEICTRSNGGFCLSLFLHETKYVWYLCNAIVDV